MSPKGKEHRRYGHLRWKFGLSREQFEEMMARQHGRCAICGDPLPSPRVDHDHKTGRVRGLLCDGCNRGLGDFRDMPALLELARRYLETT
jgi:Recombination endonuclease VII